MIRLLKYIYSNKNVRSRAKTKRRGHGTNNMLQNAPNVGVFFVN